VTIGYTKFIQRGGLALALLVLTLGSSGARAQTVLHIAAASDLQPVMPVFAQAYEKKTGVKLEVTLGSSSALATQILNGAPMDVFLGADYLFPEKVVAAGLSDSREPVPYAEGTLVLWARKDSAIKPLTMDRLTDAAVTRVAVADEFHAPYGRAAYAAMHSLKIYEQIKGKLVTAENVAQTAQFVESGNAQLGFISLTLASSDRLKQVGEFVRVPFIYPHIRQCGVVVKSSHNLVESRRFLKWLTSPEVQDNLTKFGLLPTR
jgi:molybdate transport system substrate-binding protein